MFNSKVFYSLRNLYKTLSKIRSGGPISEKCSHPTSTSQVCCSCSELRMTRKANKGNYTDFATPWLYEVFSGEKNWFGSQRAVNCSFHGSTLSHITSIEFGRSVTISHFDTLWQRHIDFWKCPSNFMNQKGIRQYLCHITDMHCIQSVLSTAREYSK